MLIIETCKLKSHLPYWKKVEKKNFVHADGRLVWDNYFR